MTPAAIIHEAKADGVSLSLSTSGTIKAIGKEAAVNRWLPTIRQYKPEIVAALKDVANETVTASRWWLIHYPDREPVEVWTSPSATHAEVLADRPEANAAEPIWLPPPMEILDGWVSATRLEVDRNADSTREYL